jgi:hypothetical protein
MRWKSMLASALAGLWIAWAPALAAPPTTKPMLVEERGRPGTPDHILVRAVLSEAAIRLSGEVRLTFSVEGPAPLRVTLHSPPLAPASAAVWKLLEVGPAGSEQLPAGRELWRQEFRLLPFAAGEGVPVIPAPLSVRAGTAAAETEIKWDASLVVHVITEVSQPDLTELRPIVPVEAAPGRAPSAGDGSGILAVVGVAALGAMVLVYLRYRARRRGQPVDPVARTISALARLRGRTGPSSGVLQELADIVRGYAEFRLDTPATRLTTQELLAGLRRGDALSGEPLVDLQAILEAGDLAKFAGADESAFVPAEGTEQLLDRAIRFVEQTSPAVRIA